MCFVYFIFFSVRRNTDDGDDNDDDDEEDEEIESIPCNNVKHRDVINFTNCIEWAEANEVGHGDIFILK